MSCWSLRLWLMSSEVTEGTLHGLFLQVPQTQWVPTLGYGHQGSCRLGICTLQPLSYPGYFSSSFCQLYIKYRHALGAFIFTQLSKESVKWITCGTCIYSTKINKTQPQDHFLVFKALGCWWTQPWQKYLLRWQSLPLWALTAPTNTMSGQLCSSKCTLNITPVHSSGKGILVQKQHWQNSLENYNSNARSLTL